MRMTPGMKAVLWDDVERQKGYHSLWHTDFNQAHASICAVWQARGFPNMNVSQKQLRDFFRRAAARNCHIACAIDEIFVKGMVLLKPQHHSRIFQHQNNKQQKKAQFFADLGSSVHSASDNRLPQTGPQHQSERSPSLQSIDKIDPCAIDHGPPSTPEAAAPETLVTYRFESFNILMSQGRHSFLPKDDMLQELHLETFCKITAVVDKVIGTTNYSRERNPQFVSTARSSGSFPLLERIFGFRTSSPGELVQKIVNNQMQSISLLVDVSTALRALVGAAVFEWILQPSKSPSSGLSSPPQTAEQNKKHEASFIESFYFQKREYSSTLEHLLSEGCSQLYDQLVLKSKYLTVEQGFDYETQASTLASRSCEVLKGFLTENLWSLDPVNYIQLHNGLKDVFISALKLKAQTCLEPESYSFLWPLAEVRSDSGTMEVDGGAHGGDHVCDMICLTLFPALVRAATVKYDPARTLVRPAVVLL
ncbi:MAG: hypothetical protein Q9178_006903 [Gyalolechia marmorata]